MPSPGVCSLLFPRPNLTSLFLILTLRNDLTRPKPKRHIKDIITFPRLSDIKLYWKCDTYVPNITGFHVSFASNLSSCRATPATPSTFSINVKNTAVKTDLKLSASKTGRQREVTRAVSVQLRPRTQWLIDVMNSTPE